MPESAEAGTGRRDRRREVIAAPGIAEPPGWSHAVAAAGWIFGGGIMATDFVSGLLPEARARPIPWTEEPLGAESRSILEQMGQVLAPAGGDIRRDLLRLWQWIRSDYPCDADYAAGTFAWPAFPSGTPYARNLAEMVGDPLRSSTGIGVRQLAVPEALLSVDFLAADPRAGRGKEAVRLPPDLPQPKIGYSPATRLGDWLFLAGFGATDFRGDWGAALGLGPPSMVAPEARVNPYIWLGSEIETQTDYTLGILSRIAEAAGSSLARCVKADVTIAHPSDFAGMDRVWRRYFPGPGPARNVVTGAQLVIKGLRVEIALLLVADDSPMPIDHVELGDGPAVPGHAPHAVHAGDLLFTSALLPLCGAGEVPVHIRPSPTAPFFRDPGALQTDRLVETLERICGAAGASIENVCKVQAFLGDMGYLPGMLRAWRNAFPHLPPCLGAVAMGGPDPLLAPGAVVQWDAIVFAPRRKPAERRKPAGAASGL